MLIVVPMYDRILVARDNPEAVSEGGIFIPEQARSRMNTGTVLRIGHGRPCPAIGSVDERGNLEMHLEPLKVRVGDKVLFSTYAGTEVVIDKVEKAFLLKEDEVLAILKETPDAPGSPVPTSAA